MNRRRLRIISVIWGVAAIGVTIWLESRELKVASQIFIWTAAATTGPIGMALTTQEFRQGWFVLGLLTSGVIHAGILLAFSARLPAPSALAPLLFGGIEAVGLAVILGLIRDRGW
jgi:hypothetical protein